MANDSACVIEVGIEAVRGRPWRAPAGRAWRQRLGLSNTRAAAALGLSRRQVIRYQQDPESALDAPPFPVPRIVALACEALQSAQCSQDALKHRDTPE